MEIYSKILLQRRKRWKIYPDEKWFQFKDGSKQQVYCPLANVTVDFCDQSTYTLTNPIINGNIYFSSKVHMGQILIQAETKLIPPLGGALPCPPTSANQCRTCYFLPRTELPGSGLAIPTKEKRFTK